MCNHVDPEIVDRLEQYGKMMRGNAAVTTWGWNIFDLPTNTELAHFFATRTRPQMEQFEEDVFVNGQDPRTYIRIQMMKESTATVKLSKEILEKETKFHSEENHGGVKGHPGEQASSTSGFRNGHHPTMDNPGLDGEQYRDYYKVFLEKERKEIEKKAMERMKKESKRRR